MNPTNEIWKPVVGWDDLYEVSNFGNIRSLDRTITTQRKGTKYTKTIKGIILTPQKDKDGYLVIHMRDASKGKDRLLKMHRLVAEAFILNPNNYKCIDHINGIRHDNRASNLRWCTVKQNANFELAHNNRSKSIKESYNKYPELRSIRAKTLGRTRLQPIIAYKNGKKLGRFNAISDFCREYGLNYCYFHNGMRKTGSYKGYSIERI